MMTTKNNLLKALFGKGTLAVFGTGNTAQNFIGSNRWLLDFEIFFLDNKRHGLFFFDKEVKDPKVVCDWEDTFVIITSVYLSEIKKQLEGYGLKEGKDFIRSSELQNYVLERIAISENKNVLKDMLHNSQCPEDISDLEKKALSEEIETVCFRLENVLLLGNIQNIYKLIEKKIKLRNFAEIRKMAERTVCYQTKRKHADIDIIYSFMEKEFKIEKEIVKKAMSAEIELVKRLLQPRKCMKNIYEQLRKCEKKICIISGLAYGKDVLEEVLVTHNFDGYDSICLEREFDDALNYLRHMISVSEGCKQTVLYIGGEYSTDIRMVASCGAKFFYIPTPLSALTNAIKLSKYFRYFNKSTVDNSVIYDLIINEIFDNPFIEYDPESLLNGDVKNMALILFVPLILEFVLWMYREAIETNIDQLILVYRDGYLPGKILDIIKQYRDLDFECKQIYLSRAIRYSGAVKSKTPLWEAIEQMPISKMMTVEQFVIHRLGVCNEKEKRDLLQYIQDSVGKTSTDPVIDFIELSCIYSKLNESFCKHAKKRFEVTNEYCHSIIGDSKKTLVFDIGYRGSVVDYLFEKCGIATKGIHLFKRINTEQNEYGNINTKGFLTYGTGTTEELMILNPLFEDILSSQEGTSVAIEKTKDGYSVLKMEKHMESLFIKKIQEEIILFSEKFVSIYQEYLSNLNFDPYNDFKLISDFLMNPYKKDANILKEMRFEDSTFILGTAQNDFYENWMSVHGIN